MGFRQWNDPVVFKRAFYGLPECFRGFASFSAMEKEEERKFFK